MGETVSFRRMTAIAVVVVAASALSGCALFGGSAKPTPTHTRKPTHSAVPTPTATPAALATPTPTGTPVPPPTLASVPAGTVVAEGDVASPKGSIHFHYRMVANGDNTYTAQYSGFTSTVPVPVSVTLLETPPSVGDGLTFHGVGDHSLGGPTTSAASSTALLSTGQPSDLVALVTYSSVASADGVPVELGPDKVLAVNTVHWSVPVRDSNVHPADGGARPGANGTVTASTSSGAPRRYAVAQGDLVDAVAQRFGISSQALIWLNSENGAIGADQHLFASTTLNLDPDDL